VALELVLQHFSPKFEFIVEIQQGWQKVHHAGVFVFLF